MRSLLNFLVLVGVLAVAIGLVFIYSGSYDVAATSGQNALTRWVLETTRERSVAHRAESVQVPALDDSAMIRLGAAHYREMCAQCHGGPGVRRGELAEGLDPTPPDLSKSARDMTPAELYWITRHGIKMTGMPAWGPTHDEAKLWAMVAFMEKLPGMSSQQYRELLAQAPAGVESEESHPDSTEGPAAP